MEYPTVSILIPTLNAASVLGECLKSISIQTYPKEKIEILIADGGSADSTLTIAREFNAKIVPNNLKTGEAGKKVALDAASGEYVALIDSDNILPTSEWLREMIIPLVEHAEAVGSEPWCYSYRTTDKFIDRYCALVGVNDPYVIFLGNYDRLNLLTGQWTEVPREEEDFGNYLLITFKSQIPTIGANGTVLRTSFLKKNVVGNYLFDIDILTNELRDKGLVKFIKVKNGIIHTFCGENISKFARKQKRRARDFFFHAWKVKDRDHVWYSEKTKNLRFWQTLKFCIYCVTIVPLIYQVIKGYVKKPDRAWWFHILACEITLYEYGIATISSVFKLSELDRKNWSQ